MRDKLDEIIRDFGQFLSSNSGQPFSLLNGNAGVFFLIYLYSKKFNQDLSKQNLDNLFLKGLNRICKVAGESGYIIKVRLNHGLTTTYNKLIDYKPEMSGTAEIVTKDLRLIERIFNSIRKIFDR